MYEERSLYILLTYTIFNYIIFYLSIMSTELDISFCDTCTLRGVIGPDMLCAREALAFAQEVVGRTAIVVNEENETIEAVEQHEVPFGGYFTRGVVRCIASVSRGGRPVPASED